MPNLYEQIGGKQAVDQAVEVFYRKILSDERVRHFFDDVDMDQQIAKQKAFLTMAFGGPNEYSGQDLRRGHAHLLERGLGEEHVDIIIEHLAESLRELNVEESNIQEVAKIAESARDDVLNR